jgi:hypothetical protein
MRAHAVSSLVDVAVDLQALRSLVKSLQSFFSSVKRRARADNGTRSHALRVKP